MHHQSLTAFVVHAAVEPDVGCNPPKLVEGLKQWATSFWSNEPFLGGYEEYPSFKVGVGLSVARCAMIFESLQSPCYLYALCDALLHGSISLAERMSRPNAGLC